MVGRLALSTDGIGDARVGGEQGAELGRRGVAPDQPDQHRLAAEGREVAGDVAGAAGHGQRPAEPHHRDRRLGRDPLHRAVEEAVEHDVAEDEDAQRGEVEHAAGIDPRMAEKQTARGLPPAPSSNPALEAEALRRCSS